MTEEESSLMLAMGKMELLSFERSGAHAWLACVEEYFLVHKIPAAEKVELAVIALSGSSMSWCQLLI